MQRWSTKIQVRYALLTCFVATAAWLAAPSVILSTPAVAQEVDGCTSCEFHLECYAQTCWTYEDCDGRKIYGCCEIWPGGTCWNEDFCRFALLPPSLWQGEAAQQLALRITETRDADLPAGTSAGACTVDPSRATG